MNAPASGRAAVQVLSIRSFDRDGAVRAFVDLQIGGVTIKGAKIVQQDSKPPWLAMPSVKNGHGWQQVVELSEPLRKRVTEVALAAWQSRQPEQTPGGAVLEAAPYRRRPSDGPRDPGQRDTGDPDRPFDDDLPF